MKAVRAFDDWSCRDVNSAMRRDSHSPFSEAFACAGVTPSRTRPTTSSQ